MTIAENKKQQNIIEYLLYMWQMEDLARAADFKTDVYKKYLESASLSAEQLENELTWFSNMTNQMAIDGVKTTGHIRELHDIVKELGVLHTNILTRIKDKEYLKRYAEARPHLEEFIQKLNSPVDNEIECCMIGLYGLFVLRLRGKKVSSETETAMNTFSGLLACLAIQYRTMKEKELRKNLN